MYFTLTKSKTMFFNRYFFILLIIFLLPIHFALGIYIYLSHDLPSTQDVRNVELQVPLKIFTSDGKSTISYSIPLPQIIDILTDLWEADGLYD